MVGSNVFLNTKAEDGSGVKRKKAMKDKKGRKNDIADGVQLFFKEHEVAAKRDKKVFT